MTTKRCGVWVGGRQERTEADGVGRSVGPERRAARAAVCGWRPQCDRRTAAAAQAGRLQARTGRDADSAEGSGGWLYSGHDDVADRSSHEDVGRQVRLSQLADSLSSQLDKPAVDMTGLDKRYDITLDFAPDMGAMQAKNGGMMMMGGPGPGPMGGGAGAGAGAGEARPGGHGDADPTMDSASLFTALQEQLGLKLEPRKAKVDLIVVDSANRSPTEN